MSEEQNFSEASTSVAPPPPAAQTFEDGESSASGANGAGSGVSKSRRRRRKRKNRSAQGAGSNPQGGEGQLENVEAAGEGSSDAAPSASQPRQQSGGQQQAGEGQGGRRKKKKKFRRAGEGGGNGQPRPEPGNSLQGSHAGQGSGMRRNRKQQQGRGPRSFVGPMDHSYREVNGNYADAPASTINLNGNHGGGGGHRRQHSNRHFNEDRLPPELMNHYKPVAIPEDAPTHIYFFIEDLFFTAKINEVAKQQGVKVAFMKPEKDVVAHLAELHDHEHPSLIVFDLNNAAAKPLTLIPKLKAKLKKGTSILGFLSHLQGDLKQKAMEAGCHTVMPRSAFSQNLPNLLRRYGVDEGDEPNYNM